MNEINQPHLMLLLTPRKFQNISISWCFCFKLKKGYLLNDKERDLWFLKVKFCVSAKFALNTVYIVLDCSIALKNIFTYDFFILYFNPW